LAAQIKEHAERLGESSRQHGETSRHNQALEDLAKQRLQQDNMYPLGMDSNNQPLVYDRKSGRAINPITGQPPAADTKMSSLGTGRGAGNSPQMMRYHLAQTAYPDDPKKAAEVALGIRPPTDLQIDNYLVKNFPQLVGKSPREIAIFREQFKRESFGGAGAAGPSVKPMPTDKSLLEKNGLYDVPGRGRARWDGDKFIPE
jgi:hypothetical protein